MRLTKHKRKTLGGMNMTPMIDIVFLLLIFFITVTQITKINKERMELAKQKGSIDQKPTNLTINITQDGAVVISGREMTVPELIVQVGKELQRVGDDPSLITVSIRADQRGDSSSVNEVVSALENLNIKKVMIAVEVPQE